MTDLYNSILKCIDCEHMTIDDRRPVVECGCSYNSPDGRWNFSIGYLNEGVIESFIYDEDGCPIDMNIVEKDERCPL